ncbi:C40 family peptidase [Sinomicrobium sp.]
MIRVLVCLLMMIVVVSCKTTQNIVPVTDEYVNMEFGELPDLGKDEDTDDESYLIIAPITDEDIEKEFGETESVTATTPTPTPIPQRVQSSPEAVTNTKFSTVNTELPEMDAEPLNAAIELETGQLLLTDSESSIMLDEVEVVGIRREEQFTLESLSGYHLIYLKHRVPQSSPLVREVRIKEYSPITVEDKIYFGKRLKVRPIKVKNARLYAFVRDNLGKPYRKNSRDHLTLMQNLYREVYEINFPRTTSKAVLNNYTEDKIHYTKDMEEGDLLFFRLRQRGRGPYTHMGIYLQNNRFLTVTPSGGVVITNLRNKEWRTTYIGRGRVKNMVVDE